MASNKQPSAISVEAGVVGPTAQLDDGKQWISLDGISFRATN